MTRTFRTAVGLAMLALAPEGSAAQVAGSLDEAVGGGWFAFTPFTQGEPAMRAGRLPHGDADRATHATGGQPGVRVIESSTKRPAITDWCPTGTAAHTDFSKCDRPRVAARRNARAAALLRAAREQAPSAAGARTLRRSLQGGLFGLGVGDTVWGGGFFGAGVTSAPFRNLALLGDGHLVGGFDGGAAFYGSGTVALRGIIPDSSREEIAGVAGVGVGLFVAGGYVAAGPQFVFGLEGKAGFSQIRILRFPDGDGAFVLLGGFRF